MSVVRCARLFPSKVFASSLAPSIITSSDSALLLSRKITQRHGNLRLLPATFMTQRSVLKDIHSISEQRTSMESRGIQRKTSFIERILKKAGILDMQIYRSMYLGYRVYEHVISQVDYPIFFKHFNMADTFFSWFLVTELHVWMIMVRYMADEKHGKIVRNNVVSAMWDDTKARVDNLGQIRNKLKHKQIEEIAHQFNAAIIGYDEGIQSDDKTLAGALWRRFFQLECNNPEHVETLLIYVRKQICLFDSLPTHEILKQPILKLIDLKTLYKLKQ